MSSVRVALLAGFLIAGCAIKTPPSPDVIVEDALPPTTEVSAEWTEPADDNGRVDNGWIESFGEPELEALVAEAVSLHNPNMRLAAARIDRAAAAARLAGSALKPTVALGAELLGTAGNEAVADRSAAVGLGVSWEPDIWGRVRAGASAADENLRATRADFEYARQSLAAQVAKTWFLATELELQVALGAETVDILRQLVDLVETKQDVGQVSMQDVHLARADLALAEEALRQAIGGKKEVQRGLELLLGRYPAAEVETADELVPVPPPIPVGLPADLIQRRPDLVAAERRVAAAFFLTEQARLARLPSFPLTAGVGGSSALGDVIVDLGAGMVAPIFTGGALGAQVDSATADQEAAIAAYGTSLLRAFEEVETALTNEKLFAEREAYLNTVVDENEEALKLAKVRFEVGRIDLLSVLQIQTKWIGARIGLLRIRNDRLAQRVNLHLALGGSFERIR
jgi:NodT family efflux transporter outer membrane factor (OMF) lipoprotein